MTALEWLLENSHLVPKNKINKRELIKQSKEMEKQQQGYSEEDLEEAFKSGFTNCYNNNNLTFGEWFEQFKNK